MIWGFGDSFTYGFGCRTGWGFDNTDNPIPEYYIKHKKEGDKIWIEWLGEWFNEDIKNIAQAGASNDKIFDWMLENFEHIKENDKVIIGITNWGRIDVPINQSWKSILSAWEYGGLENKKHSDIDDKFWEVIINYQYFFSDSPLWKDRWSTRFDFILKQLNKKKCQIILFQIQEPLVLSIQTIRQEIGIPDDHFSFGGHKKFAEIIYRKFTAPLI
jgi:hypothetical protein